MPLLYFLGDNVLELDEAVKAARARFADADVLTFDGSDAPLVSLTEACLTAGLFAPDRLVQVHGLHERLKTGRKDGTATDEIRSLLSNIPPTTTLLLIGKDVAADHPLVGLVREVRGQIKTFMAPRKGDLPRWVAARATRHGIAIEPGATEMLADLIGNNPLLLDSELEKLATYAGEEGRITPAMVEALVGAVPQDSIFGLVDAVAAGDRATALRLLHVQLDRASANPIDFALYLIRMLARQMRILLRIRLNKEAGRSNSQIVSDLKLPRYYADRYFRQAARLPHERLTATFEQLAELEHALKTGKSDAGPGLDLLIAELCT